jgi:hypothetical protein
VRETWPLTLRLRVFENRLRCRMFGQKVDEVTGGSRKLHNKELHNTYSSESIIRMIMSRRMRWAEHVASERAKTVHALNRAATVIGEWRYSSILFNLNTGGV